ISTTTEYISAFQPHKIPSAAPIGFDSYFFKKTSFTIDEGGNTDEVVAPVEEIIEIAKNWHNFINGSKSEGGYLSKGATKYAFI
ncbi:hypothetical protein C0991_002607, partial [Blastosporella zonata]